LNLPQRRFGEGGKKIGQQKPNLSGLNRREKTKGKGGRNMRRGILFGLVLGLMVLGSASVSSAQSGPVLEKIWGPAEVNWGGLLKIYIKAKGSDADLRWVLVSASRPQQMQPSGSTMIRVKKGTKDLNGFIYWDTSQSQAKSNVEAKIYISVEDWKGNESETQSVVVKLVPKGAKADKYPSDFQEVEIGPAIMPGTQRMSP
jgi:hypothetical protein